MMHYSVQPRDQIFTKGYGFLSLAQIMSKNIGKNISKYLSRVNIARNHAKQSAIDALKTDSKNALQKKLKQLEI